MFYFLSPMQPTPPDGDLKKEATTWLFAGAATFFLCGCFNLFSVIGGVLCFLSMQAAEQGHLEDAEAKLKWGKILIVSGSVLTLLVLGSGALWYFATNST
jgi:hypothetical protein